MHGLTVYVQEGLPKKFCRFLLMFSTRFTSLSDLLLFPLSITFFVFVHGFFNSISSNIDEVLSINPSVNVFVFEDFSVHHKDWFTYSGGTDLPGELCYIFLSQTALLRRLTFLRGSQTMIVIVLLFWTYFLLLTLVFALQWLFLHWEILIMLLSQFLWTFHKIHNRMPHFIA